MTEHPRRRLPRQVREREIIDAAVGVFAAHGYHAAAVDEICARAGISKPMVYLYVGSKEELFAACLRREGERLVTAFQEAAERGGTPEERLWQGLSAFFRYVTEHGDSWAILHRQTPPREAAVAAEAAQVRRAVTTAVRALFRDGIARRPDSGLDDRDAAFATHALVGAADALADWTTHHPEESADDAAVRMMNMVWVGMRNVLNGETWTAPAP